MKSAYNAIASSQDLQQDNNWKVIWKLQVPQKIRTFIWLAFHGKVLSNLERTRRRLTEDPFCHGCTRDVEDLGHIFRKCSCVGPLWQRAMGESVKAQDGNLPFKEWVRYNLLSCLHQYDENWKEHFVVCPWWLWKWRDEEVFINNRGLDMDRKIATVKAYLGRMP